MGRTSETETASWLTPNLWTVISGLTMERRVWRRGFLEKKDDQEKDLVLLFARARTTVGPLEVSSFVDIEGMPAIDEETHPLLPSKPVERRSSAKRSLEDLEGQFLEERKARRNPFAIGPRGR